MIGEGGRASRADLRVEVGGGLRLVGRIESGGIIAEKARLGNLAVGLAGELGALAGNAGAGSRLVACGKKGEP